MPRHYFAKDSQLNWDIEKSDIMVNGIKSPDHFALTRNDNSNILNIHKNSYNPFKNSDFCHLLDELQKITNFENLSYQEFKGGRFVLGYLENNRKDAVKVNGFDVNKYLVLGNTHDGSKGIFLGTSEIMLRCQNQFGKIIRSNVIRHTKNNHVKIDELKRAYEVYFNEMEKITEVYCKMNKVKIDRSIIDALTQRLFDMDTKEEISTRKQNLVNDFNLSVAKETADLGMNAFGLFHSVTHYTTHKLKSENVFGNMFGTASKMNEKALEFVTEMI